MDFLYEVFKQATTTTIQIDMYNENWQNETIFLWLYLIFFPISNNHKKSSPLTKRYCRRPSNNKKLNV